MNRSNDAPARNRNDAYFTASFEVARRLAEGRGEEAIEVLRRELDRVQSSHEHAGRRFLLSQIALCYAKMGRRDDVERVLEETEASLPGDAQTAVLLAEGHLLLLDDGGRAAHYAAQGLERAEESGENGPELLSRIHNLMARALLTMEDLVGAFGAWRSAPLPSWRVATDLIDSGYDRQAVREILADALPRVEKAEREAGAGSIASADRMKRLIAWIDSGCPQNQST
jgi:tetratricopeptide (TPR) repeat protein